MLIYLIYKFWLKIIFFVLNTRMYCLIKTMTTTICSFVFTIGMIACDFYVFIVTTYLLKFCVSLLIQIHLFSTMFYHNFQSFIIPFTITVLILWVFFLKNICMFKHEIRRINLYIFFLNFL